MRYSAAKGPPYTWIHCETVYLYVVLASSFSPNSVLTGLQFSEYRVSMALFVAFLHMSIILDEYWKQLLIVGKDTYIRHLSGLKGKPVSAFPFWFSMYICLFSHNGFARRNYYLEDVIILHGIIFF